MAEFAAGAALHLRQAASLPNGVPAQVQRLQLLLLATTSRRQKSLVPMGFQA